MALSEIDIYNQRTALLAAASKWKLDAQREDMARYFFRLPNFSLIESGDRPFVVGRKGSGKTAIGDFIHSDVKYNKFSTRLSFKNFPFNELYKMSNAEYSESSQYITLWKFIVYHSLCWLMTKNEAVSAKMPSHINEYFDQDPAVALDSSIRRWMSTGVKINLFGVGGELSGGLYRASENTNWAERVDVIENYVLSNIDESHYYVIFDELDEDYSAPPGQLRAERYFDLLRSLLKAVQTIQSKSLKSGKRIIPIVLLRDDIYDAIRDHDKNKWSDLVFDLSWTPALLLDLVNHRLDRSLESYKSVSGVSLLHKVLKNSLRKSRLSGQQVPLIQFMMELTHLRPRDVLKMVQSCASEAIEKDHRTITTDVVSNAEARYSQYLRQELVDEIHPILPQIDDMMHVFPHFRSYIVQTADIEKYWKKINNTSDVFPENTVVHLLHYFSIIGRRLNTGISFRHQNRTARLTLPSAVVLHPGLRKSLFY